DHPEGIGHRREPAGPPTFLDPARIQSVTIIVTVEVSANYFRIIYREASRGGQRLRNAGGFPVLPRGHFIFFGAEHDDLPTGLAELVREAALPVAAASRLSDGVERSHRAPYARKIKVHSRFDKLGRDNDAVLTVLEPPPDVVEALQAVSRAHVVGQVQHMRAG